MILLMKILLKRFRTIGMNKLKKVLLKILVSSFIIKYIFKIVIGIAANKSDLYDNEAVPEDKARQFAEKMATDPLR